MAPLDFPSSPVNGQTYNNYVWDSSVGAWLAQGSTNNVGDQIGLLNTYRYSPNYIINGAFDFWQRGTSFNTNGVYTADRWRIAFTGTGTTQTLSQQSFTVGAAPVAGYEGTYFARNAVNGGTGNGSLVVMEQPIEDVRTFANQTVTLSFWAKANSGTPSIGYDFYQSFGSGGSATVGGIGAGKVAITTSWQRYSVTINVPSISGKTLSTGNCLILRFWFSSGSDYNSLNGSLGLQSNTFDIWGVQVEAGPVATPFRRNANSIQGELAACQRYYYRINGGFAHYLSIVRALSSTAAMALIPYKVTMRAIPNFFESSNLEIENPNVGNITVTGSYANFVTGTDLGGINLTGSGFSTSTMYWLRFSANGHVAWSAEL